METPFFANPTPEGSRPFLLRLLHSIKNGT